ncbi:hypothetical protein M0804_009518 [Polistes exclamans]|nr:hypothetical protein M0804_009518 [Polistes exclamans]
MVQITRLILKNEDRFKSTDEFCVSEHQSSFTSKNNEKKKSKEDFRKELFNFNESTKNIDEKSNHDISTKLETLRVSSKSSADSFYEISKKKIIRHIEDDQENDVEKQLELEEGGLTDSSPVMVPYGKFFVYLNCCILIKQMIISIGISKNVDLSRSIRVEFESRSIVDFMVLSSIFYKRTTDTEDSSIDREGVAEVVIGGLARYFGWSNFGEAFGLSAFTGNRCAQSGVASR